MFTKLLLILLLITITFPLWGAVYKWVDENGNVHYGDRPPSSATGSEEIDPSAVASPPDPVREKRREKRDRLLDAFQDERRQKKAVADKARADKARRETNCALARKQLGALEHARYLYIPDSGGNRRVLSDEQRDNALANARGEVQKWCR